MLAPDRQLSRPPGECSHRYRPVLGPPSAGPWAEESLRRNLSASASERMPQAAQMLPEVRDDRDCHDLFGGQTLSVNDERDTSKLLVIQAANALGQRDAVNAERIEGFFLTDVRELGGVSGVV